jgi:hypothetical protein
MNDLSRVGTNRYTYDPAGDPKNEAFEQLWLSEEDGQPHIRTFAQHMLERLQQTSLLHSTDTEPPANIRRGESRSTRCKTVCFQESLNELGTELSLAVV